MNNLAKIWVSGVVQGVGFRYFVCQSARNYDLKGIVKNLNNGKVYIEAEGVKTIIGAFIKEVRIGNRFSEVTNIEVEWKKYSNKFQSFEITF